MGLRPNFTPEQVLRSLVDKPMMQRAITIITNAVAYSFLACPVRETRAEIKHRFNISYDIFTELRAECRYPLSRLDEVLGRYLVCQLEGIPWSPLKRRCWVPGDPL